MPALVSAILAISLGASLGAVMRWGLSVGMNHWLPTLPLGTLSANLVGGYLIGLAIAVFSDMPQLPPEWRLFVITGFLGGLTTFSTFSAEVVAALQQGRLAWALATVSVHVLGSLALTLAGLATPALFRH
jgi:CrcB protein